MNRPSWVSVVNAVDESLRSVSRPLICFLSALGVFVVGAIDFITGYEISLSLFYLGPVAVAAWYAGRWPGVTVAALSCSGWYAADVAAGNDYSHAAIPVWNALIRFGFFLLASLLLTALQKSLRDQRALAQTDALTGLLTRRAFEERLQHDLALTQRRGTALTLAYLDLDDFKALNDSRGHTKGDQVLHTIGTVLTSNLRRVDTAARLGGDELALVLPDTGADGARTVVGQIVRKIDDALASQGVRVTCSVGVVTFEAPGLSLPEAVSAADALMYEVKREGKGAIRFQVRNQGNPWQRATGHSS